MLYTWIILRLLFSDYIQGLGIFSSGAKHFPKCIFPVNVFTQMIYLSSSERLPGPTCPVSGRLHNKSNLDKDTCVYWIDVCDTYSKMFLPVILSNHWIHQMTLDHLLCELVSISLSSPVWIACVLSLKNTLAVKSAASGVSLFDLWEAGIHVSTLSLSTTGTASTYCLSKLEPPKKGNSCLCSSLCRSSVQC